MRNRRVLAVVPLIIVMFAVLFHSRPLANVLPIKVDGLQDFSCMAHDFATHETYDFSMGDMDSDVGVALDQIRVFGPFPYKNVVVNGKEIAFYSCILQKGKSKSEAGPTIEAIVEEDKRYFVNIDETAYMVVSGQELFKDLIVHIQSVASLSN